MDKSGFVPFSKSNTHLGSASYLKLPDRNKSLLLIELSEILEETTPTRQDQVLPDNATRANGAGGVRYRVILQYSHLGGCDLTRVITLLTLARIFDTRADI